MMTNDSAQKVQNSSIDPSRAAFVDYFGTRMRELLSKDGCPVCRESADAENDYFSFLLVETYRDRGIQEEIAAAPGFCMRHGTQLRQHAEKPYQITFLMSALTRDVVQLLAEPTKAGGDALGFPSRLAHPCPACTLRNSVAARKISMLNNLLKQPEVAELYGHPGLLCFPHFQALLSHVVPVLFERFFTIHQQALERAKGALDTLPTTTTACPPPGAPPGTAEPLQAALSLTAGSEPGLSVWPNWKTPVDERARNSTREFAASLRRDDMCPVCLEVRRAWEEWMTWLEAATERNEILEDVLPTCAEHGWAGAQLGGPRCAAAIARNAVNLDLGRIYLAQKLMSAAPSDRRQRLSERFQSWFRGSRHRFAKARGAVALPMSCPVCRRVDAARDRGIQLLFALLQERRHRLALENGHGLCLKHFSRALALQPLPATQRVLIACESAKLASLA